MEIENQLRGYRFLLGVLRNQQGDPLCSRCSAFTNTLQAVRERLSRLEADEVAVLEALPDELQGVLAETREGLMGVPVPEQPTGQKKAGKCKLPQGVCFVKAPFSLFQQV